MSSGSAPALEGKPLPVTLGDRLRAQREKFEQGIHDIDAALALLEVRPDIDLERVARIVMAISRLPRPENL